MKYVFVVISSQGNVVGVYANKKLADVASDNYPYFCRINMEEIIK